MRRRRWLGLVLGMLMLVSGCSPQWAQSDKEVKPVQQEVKPGMEVATLGGGCFWCVEAIYDELDGVDSVVSGYSGGTVPSPSYEQVCTGTTGHAECVNIVFDPKKLSYHDLLGVFFKVHDPTTLNYQGADHGTQYRSVIFYHDETQHQVAQAVIREIEAEHIYDQPIVTQVVPYTRFYPAEGYHQDYFARNPNQGYCQLVISPKVEKFRKLFHARLKTGTASH